MYLSERQHLAALHAGFGKFADLVFWCVSCYSRFQAFRDFPFHCLHIGSRNLFVFPYLDEAIEASELTPEYLKSVLS